jgi:hypothetical protein
VGISVGLRTTRKNRPVTRNIIIIIIIITFEKVSKEPDRIKAYKYLGVIEYSIRMKKES